MFGPFILKTGGGCRIRTCEGFRPLVFKTSAINHSANPPQLFFRLVNNSLRERNFYSLLVKSNFYSFP